MENLCFASCEFCVLTGDVTLGCFGSSCSGRQIQGLLHLWHFQCSVRQTVFRRQSEVSDASTSSTALKRSLLVHTMLTLPLLSTLHPWLLREGTIIIGVPVCCHTLTAQGILGQRWSRIERHWPAPVALDQTALCTPSRNLWWRSKASPWPENSDLPAGY